jgi:hypothetical protein
MAKILEVCKQHKIPMLADFALEDADGETLKCTSFLLDDEFKPPPEMLKAMAHVMPRERLPGMMMTVTKPDGSKEITAFLD